MGANIDVEDNKALIMSAKYGHLDIVQYLVEHGSDINAGSDDDSDDDALGVSALYGHLDVVRYLVEGPFSEGIVGADIHVNEDEALISSATHDYLEIVQYLVGQGANIHARNDEALITSAGNGHLDVVRYLVEGPFPEGVIGANIHARKDRALKASVRNGHLDVASYLLKEGANPDAIPIERFRDIKSKFGHYDLATLSHKKMLDEGIEPPVDMPQFIWDITEPTSHSLKGRIIHLLKEDLSSKDRSILLSLL